MCNQYRADHFPREIQPGGWHLANRRTHACQGTKGLYSVAFKHNHISIISRQNQSHNPNCVRLARQNLKFYLKIINHSYAKILYWLQVVHSMKLNWKEYSQPSNVLLKSIKFPFQQLQIPAHSSVMAVEYRISQELDYVAEIVKRKTKRFFRALMTRCFSKLSWPQSRFVDSRESRVLALLQT